AIQGSEAHRRVDTAAPKHRCYGAAVAEVTDHQSQLLFILPQELSRPICAIPMIDAVESIAANATLEPLIRPRVDGSRQRHLAMKPGIEYSDLRNFPQKILDGLHTLQLSVDVERGKRRSTDDCLAHVRCNHDWISKMWTTMNDPVPHSIDVG